MKKQRIGIQGELGAFSQQAANQLLGNKVEVVPYTRFEEVFAGLQRHKIDAAVIPIENTLAGSVHENYDHLLHFDARIAAETSVRIVHNLIAPPGVRFKDIRRVYSHPVALNQCLRFFSRNPKFESVPYYDTAGSVKMVMAEKPSDAAAIASSVAADPLRGRGYCGDPLRTTAATTLDFSCFIRTNGLGGPRPAKPSGKPRWYSPPGTFPEPCSAPSARLLYET